MSDIMWIISILMTGNKIIRNKCSSQTDKVCELFLCHWKILYDFEFLLFCSFPNERAFFIRGTICATTTAFTISSGKNGRKP